MSVTEAELDLAIDEARQDIIDQKNSIDDAQVESHLQEMGFLWSELHEKLLGDKFCFSCSKDIDFEKDKIRVLRAGKSDRGVVAFVSVCGECYGKLESEHNNVDNNN